MAQPADGLVNAGCSNHELMRLPRRANIRPGRLESTTIHLQFSPRDWDTPRFLRTSKRNEGRKREPYMDHNVIGRGLMHPEPNLETRARKAITLLPTITLRISKLLTWT